MGLAVVSFVAGVLTVLAPCTIALLPVTVGGTLAGGRSFRRALTVTASLGLSVIIFTFLLKESTALINVPQAFWEIVSGALIALIGLGMLLPTLWDKLPGVGKLNRHFNRTLATGYLKQNFWGDVLVGAALGPVFSSCSPTYFIIIATILPKSLAQGSLDLLIYALGLCGMLLVVSIAGQKLMDVFNVASNPKSWLRLGIGIVFIILGLSIAVGFEQKFELAFANSSSLPFSHLEQKLLGNIKNQTPPSGNAPEITDPAGFINTNGQPITIGQYRGKDVVLIDFWDYSCINCEREIPYVEAWWKKYQDDGLVVIGVHTPEFSFEKLPSNVQAAVNSLGITYPVVLDNDYATWDAFNNEYWPQIYLIDTNGNIIYRHSGEGNYAETEAAIKNALAERSAALNIPNTVPTGTVNPANAVGVNDLELGSPETYFGAARNEFLGNGLRGSTGTQSLTVPANQSLNTLYLGGSWNFYPQYAETSSASSSVVYQFDAKNMYLVATGNPSAKVKVLLDGKPISQADSGADVKNSEMTIDADRLYKVVSLPSYGMHTLTLELENGTLDAYTFTFG